MTFTPVATQAVHQALKALERAQVLEPWHLRLDKLSVWEPGHGRSDSKKISLTAIRDAYNSQRDRLLEHCDRYATLRRRLRSLHGTRYDELTLVNCSRLLPHLGRVSALENVGLAFDHTTGLPVVPGTAVKGIVSAWACWEGNVGVNGTLGELANLVQDRRALPHDQEGLAAQVLGTNAGDADAGDVVFLGGVPLVPPEMELDLVNPHHGQTGQPQDPVPSPFLAYGPGALWVFSFYARPGTEDATVLLAASKRWLEEALTQHGLGAKTAASYGRFGLPTAADTQRSEQKRHEFQQKLEGARQRADQQVEQERQRAHATAALRSDYPNEATFRNTVLRLADNASQWPALQKEMDKLTKPENAVWLEKFKRATSTREHRKLREQPWYPK